MRNEEHDKENNDKLSLDFESLKGSLLGAEFPKVVLSERKKEKMGIKREKFVYCQRESILLA